MKKLISIISALAIAAGLTACSKSGSPAENTSNDLNPPQSETSLQSSSSSQSVTSSEESAVSSTYPENAIAPDGSVVNFSEAVQVEQEPYDVYTFDHAFVRLAEGTLCATNEDPELYDWNTKEFAEDLSASEPRYTKVKAGDTLANGLTVIEALSRFSNNPGSGDDLYNGFTTNYVEFGNKNTELTGYLRCIPYLEETVYNFYADPSQSDPIPVSFCKGSKRFGIKIVDEEALKATPHRTRDKVREDLSVFISGTLLCGVAFKQRRTALPIKSVKIYRSLSRVRFCAALLLKPLPFLIKNITASREKNIKKIVLPP